jgi:hypothetical protein
MPLNQGDDYDRFYTRERDGSQHRVAGLNDQTRDNGTHIVREGGRNSPIDYARIDGVVLTQEQLDKINSA